MCKGHQLLQRKKETICIEYVAARNHTPCDLTSNIPSNPECNPKTFAMSHVHDTIASIATSMPCVQRKTNSKPEI